MSSKDVTSKPEDESESDLSTVVYDHEPFDTFKLRVQGLCRMVLAPFDGEITIERMHGGGFNRVIGVSIADSKTPTITQYVCRVPRFDTARLDRDLAPLQLLRQRNRIQVPDVVASDTTTQNVLQRPYMIQKRLPGSSLFPTYPNLPHEMKCAIARELGQVFAELHSIRSVSAGRLTLSSQNLLMIQPFDNTEIDAAVPYENGPATQTPSDMLYAILEDKKRLAVAAGPTHLFRVSFFTDLITMASQMSAFGLLDEKYYCLCHLDLEPRNILVSRPSDDQSQTITGILDWDSALFAPPFMSCTPPMWVWAWNDEDDEDERLANNWPTKPKLRELKQLFEDAAGPIYHRFAYDPEYRLARRLLRFGIDGLRSNEDLISAELLLAEWKELVSSKSVKANMAIP